MIPESCRFNGGSMSIHLIELIEKGGVYMLKICLTILMVFSLFVVGCSDVDLVTDEPAVEKEAEEEFTEYGITKETQDKLEEKATTYLRIRYGDKDCSEVDAEQLMHPEVIEDYMEEDEIILYRADYDLYEIVDFKDFEVIDEENKINVTVEIDTAVSGTRKTHSVVVEFVEYEGSWMVYDMNAFV